jgi:O-antigen ligase
MPRALGPYGNAARYLAALACLAYPWLHPGARGPTLAVEPLLVSLCCVVLLLALSGATARAEIPRTLPAYAVAGALLIWMGDFVARGDALPSPAVVAAWLVLAGIAACAALGTLARDGGLAFPWSASLLAWAWLAAGLISTVIALAQHFGVADVLGPFAAYSPGRQAYGNLRQRNHYATLANIGLLSLVWLTLHGKPALPRWAAAVAALLLCAGAAASVSRMGAVELVAVLALAAWWHRHAARKAAWLFVPLLCYVAAAVVLLYVIDPAGQIAPNLLKRLAGDVPDCPSRTVLWQNMMQLVIERPWLGWGWRELSYAFYMGDFDPRFCALVHNAHNLPLHLAVELGVPAALALTAACIWAIVRARPWAQTDPARRLAWGVIMLIVLHSLLEFPLWYGPFQIALGLCLGLLCAPGTGLRIPRGALAACALAFAGIAVYTAMDYRRVRQLYLPTEARAPALRDDTFEKVRSTWLFQDQLAFARLMRIPLHRGTADEVHRLSGQLLHFSPEPRVLEKRIQSARLLDLDGEAAAEARRYQAAFPAAYAAWARQDAKPAE